MSRKTLLLAAFAALLFAGAANANMLTNGGFETGDFTGWTVSSGPFTFVGSPGYLSSNEAILGTAGSVETISQTFATTPGQSYDVSFYLANDDFANSNSFSALWNGTSMLAPAFNSDAFEYTKYSFSAIANSTNSTLSFAFQNDNSVFHLDDVNATVPEPGSMWLLSSGLLGLIGIKKKLA
jgi:hypothetical protein